MGLVNEGGFDSVERSTLWFFLKERRFLGSSLLGREKGGGGAFDGEEGEEEDGA